MSRRIRRPRRKSVSMPSACNVAGRARSQQKRTPNEREWTCSSRRRVCLIPPDCIWAHTPPSPAVQFISFRDSKLTFILRDFLFEGKTVRLVRPQYNAGVLEHQGVPMGRREAKMWRTRERRSHSFASHRRALVLVTRGSLPWKFMPSWDPARTRPCR